jgi:hypothetical protein
MWDTANQYVSVADSTGLIPLILFVATIVYGFKYAGKARRAWAGNKNMELYNWSLGAAMFANVVSFVGISYWDQTQVVWYSFLAIMATAYLAVPSPMLSESAVTVQTQEAPPMLSLPLKPAYKSEPPKELTSYGRMVTGRWPPKSTTK